MNDTPRTDEREAPAGIYDEKVWVVPVSVSRYFERELSAMTAERDRLANQVVALLGAIQGLEASHTGMLYGDEKRNGVSDYTRGWGDCLGALKSALGIAA